jgi:hypothetical protein
MMVDEPCYHKIRFTLSDASGVLRFTSFDIMGGLTCSGAEEKLKSILLDRPLLEIDLDEIRSLPCKGDGHCLEETARIVAEQQELLRMAEKERR